MPNNNHVKADKQTRKSQSRPLTSSSKELRVISQLARRRGNRQQALRRLDGLAGELTASQKKEKSKIISQLADIAVFEGDSAEAIARYEQAEMALDANEPRAWFRPAAGKVRVKIKETNITEALSDAHRAITRAATAETEYLAELQAQAQNLKTGNKILVRERPIRASVVASKIGQNFLGAGEMNAAKEVFSEAIAVNPNGATRAREGLAKIAMLEGNPAEAENRCREALLLGKYQAKTVSLWQTLIRARTKQGKGGYEKEWLAGLDNTLEPDVKARGYLALIKALRANNDPSWRDLKAVFQGKRNRNPRNRDSSHNSAGLELDKTDLAEARINFGNRAEINTIAQAILDNPASKPKDAVFAAKEWLRSLAATGVLQDKNKTNNASAKGQEQGQGNNNTTATATTTGVDWRTIANNVHTKWGFKTQGKVLHSMALGAMLAKNHDLAREILQENINQFAPKPGTPAYQPVKDQYGKSLWALARMERVLQNYQEASRLFLEFASHQGIPALFRIAAFREWSLVARESPAVTGNLQDGKSVAETIRTAVLPLLAQINDYQPLLAAARAMTTLGSDLADVAQAFYDKGAPLAIKAINDSPSHAAALKPLVILARSEFYDFHFDQKVIDSWRKSIQPEQEEYYQAAIRSNKMLQAANLWEYVVIVAKSYQRLGQSSSALNVLDYYFAKADLPANAGAWLGVCKGEILITSGQKSAGLELLEQTTSANSFHPACGRGFYWLALFAYINGDSAKLADYTKQGRLLISGKSALLADNAMDARMQIMQEELLGINSSTQTGLYADGFLAEQKNKLERLVSQYSN